MKTRRLRRRSRHRGTLRESESDVKTALQPRPLRRRKGLRGFARKARNPWRIEARRGRENEFSRRRDGAAPSHDFVRVRKLLERRSDRQTAFANEEERAVEKRAGAAQPDRHRHPSVAPPQCCRTILMSPETLQLGSSAPGHKPPRRGGASYTSDARDRSGVQAPHGVRAP